MLEFNAGVSGGSSGWGGGGARQEEGCAQLLSEHLFGQKKKKSAFCLKRLFQLYSSLEQRFYQPLHLRAFM